jgi:cell division protein FtsZ
VEEMEEISRFTDRFLSKDIEVIWGLATDESLDEDVKITILATGFGVSNIPGMNTTIEVNNASVEQRAETEEEQAERRQQEEKNRELISKYYGDTKLAAKRTIHAFVMEGDDLFNDDLVDAIDSLPTYKRGKQDLAELANYRR